MALEFCGRCKKYIAVVFLRKKRDGETGGVCLACARKIGLPQVDEMMKKMGITDEDLEQIQRDVLETMRENQPFAAEEDSPLLGG